MVKIHVLRSVCNISSGFLNNWSAWWWISKRHCSVSSQIVPLYIQHTLNIKLAYEMGVCYSLTFFFLSLKNKKKCKNHRVMCLIHGFITYESGEYFLCGQLNLFLEKNQPLFKQQLRPKEFSQRLHFKVSPSFCWGGVITQRSTAVLSGAVGIYHV